MNGNDRVVIRNDKAPAPIGPYSQAIRAGNLVFVSGQLGLDTKTGELVGPDAPSQARKAIEHIISILDLAETGLGRVLKTTIFLTDLKDFAAVNKVYSEYFVDEPPARSTIQVAALPKGACVEIEVVALVVRPKTTELGSGLL
jgi:2-iminobutanoate/2-iminopropanoate deaminase